MLQEFRDNKHRRWELRDILGHAVEFSADQHGSRFMQHRYEAATADVKQKIFDEIVPGHVQQLVQDVFGNYVIQKLFEFGTAAHRAQLMEAVKGSVLSAALNMYGCRVIQKAIDFITPEQQALFVNELEPHIMRCVKDANGNHVVQKMIERVPVERLSFIRSFQGNVYELSSHPYGCRVLQRCLEHIGPGPTRSLLDELQKYTTELMQDQFGNYVVQFLLEKGEPQDRAAVINKLRGQMLPMARHKFASNVVEKALVTADSESRWTLIDELMRQLPDGTFPIVIMMKDQYANYVLQRAMTVAEGQQQQELCNQVRAPLMAMRKVSTVLYSKHLNSSES
ncbi:ARM repeat-containing protein [Vararia minispora EC-137]|uniref:ARM repeat-containing protein n=1 Tax=Vararia minispora EC-137 TaxID=1314806 RepID=A0ACB8QTB3_9AGAM|nr:ARM repeat-containing protein [Vararia minispora EC-137]